MQFCHVELNEFLRLLVFCCSFFTSLLHFTNFYRATANAYTRSCAIGDIHPLLDYDASESQSLALGLMEIGLLALYGFSVRFQYYAAVARSVCDS